MKGVVEKIIFDMRKKKLSIIGAGNAGCITAISNYLYGIDIFDIIDIYHDPSYPMEKVGQGSILPISMLLNQFFYLDFVKNNLIQSTRKEGIMYENWGKKKEKIFHSFPQCTTAVHYIPSLLSKAVLECGRFNVIEKNIVDPEKEIDSDFIIDCRGRHNRSSDLYDTLINPLNSVILAKKEGAQPELLYTKTVATPNGWTFVIPNTDSVAYGYLFNDQVTTKEDAYENFKELFEVEPKECLKFENYLAKDCFQGERTILNGNRLSFLEPLEATSTGFYLQSAEYSFEYMTGNIDKKICNHLVRDEMFKLQNFVLWHYQFGSKYDTPFWDYAKSLPFNPDKEFENIIKYSDNTSFSDQLMEITKFKGQTSYSQWPSLSFKCWIEGVK